MIIKSNKVAARRGQLPSVAAEDQRLQPRELRPMNSTECQGDPLHFQSTATAASSRPVMIGKLEPLSDARTTAEAPFL